MTQVTTSEKKFYIDFGGDHYDPTSPGYQADLLAALLHEAMHFDTSYRNLRFDAFHTICQDLQVEESSLGWAFEDVILPMFEQNCGIYPDSFGDTLADCKRHHDGVNYRDTAVLEVCQKLYDAGLKYREWFVNNYSRYFEEAIAAQPYAPKYAFYLACHMAGLPLDTWVRMWRDDGRFGYYSDEDVKYRSN